MCHKAMGQEPTPIQAQVVLTLYRQILNVEVQGVSSGAYTQMGLDLWRGGKLDESIRAYRKALEEDEANSRAQFNLALAYLAQGKVEAAESAYAEGMKRFGRAAAEGVGAETALGSLIDRGIQVEAARKLLETYWPSQ